MHFLQAVQAPVMCTLPPVREEKLGRMLLVPKYTIDDFVEWGVEIEQKIVDRVTEGLDEMRMREYLSLYPPSAPDMNELRRLIYTPPGMQRIVQTCLMRAKVFEWTPPADGQPGEGTRGAQLPPLAEDEIKELIKALGTGRLSALAWELADLVDKSQVVPPAKNSKTGKKDGDEQSPLTGSGRQLSTSSSGTGSKKSASSKSPTPEDVSASAP